MLLCLFVLFLPGCLIRGSIGVSGVVLIRLDDINPALPIIRHIP